MINSKIKILLILLMGSNISLCMENRKEVGQYNSENILGKFVTPIVGIQKIIFKYSQEWKRHKELKVHTDDVKAELSDVISVAYSPDGKYVASSSTDTIRIWDLNDEKCLHVLNDHKTLVCSLVYSNDGKRLFSSAWDGYVKIWDTSTGICIKTLLAGSNGNGSISISPDNNSITSIFKDHNITVWDVNVNSKTYGDCIKKINDNNIGIYTLAYDKSGRYIASGSWTKHIKLWDTSNGSCVKEFKDDKDICSKGIYALDFSHCDKYLASGDTDNKIKIWDILTGNCLLTIIAHDKLVNSISFSPCGNYLASSSDDEKLKCWDAKTGECIQVLPNEAGHSISVKYSKCGNFLASGFNNNRDDGTVIIWKNIASDLLRNTLS